MAQTLNPYSPAELSRPKQPKPIAPAGYDVMSGPAPMNTTPAIKGPVTTPQIGLKLGFNK